MVFDPKTISYDELLEKFFEFHNPTQLNRQGPDVGPQYRSAIFYQNDEERALAEASKKALDESGRFDKDVVTEIVPLKAFYEAEDYHQDYFINNSHQPYCQAVVAPKVAKTRQKYAHLLA